MELLQVLYNIYIYIPIYPSLISSHLLISLPLPLLLLLGDILSVRNIVIDRFFGDMLDDVRDALSVHPPILQFLHELQNKVNLLIREVDGVRNGILKRINEENIR